MTRFISVRTLDVGGPVTPAVALESVPAQKPTYTPIPDLRLDAEVAGRDIVIAVHGFNVSRSKAVRSFALLEAHLELTENQLFFGVLWPGDAWIPVINYPFEAGDAVDGGGKVADFVNRRFAAAASISLISHSLGGRLLLEVASRLQRRTRVACITAGAVDDDCLQRQYKGAKSRSDAMAILASKSDRVLQLAYPLGDFASDLFWRDNDSPWRGALGRSGPHPQESNPPVRHLQIPTRSGYGHGDYFPPSEFPTPAIAPDARWLTSVAYMRRVLNGGPSFWP